MREYVTGGNKSSAFIWAIYSRIVEANCQRFGIPYERGSSQSKTRVTPNGPRLAVDDVVRALHHVSPTTFHNHRGAHNQAKRVLAKLDKIQSRNEEQTELHSNLTDLFRTPLAEVGKLDHARYGIYTTLVDTIKRFL
jgi:hypothetical protein